MTLRLSLSLLLLAGCATSAACWHAASLPPLRSPPPRRAEDARLNAFLDAAFDETIALSPESADRARHQDQLRPAQRLYRRRRRARAWRWPSASSPRCASAFDVKRLGPPARLSYRLFEIEVERARTPIPFRDYGFPVSTNGSPAGSIPVFLINQHRVDSVADARAYVARLREIERVMGEIAAKMREPGRAGHRPAQDGVQAGARGRRQGHHRRAVRRRPRQHLLADFRKKVDRARVAPAEKGGLIADAEAALTGPFRRGYDDVRGARRDRAQGEGQ